MKGKAKNETAHDGTQKYLRTDDKSKATVHDILYTVGVLDKLDSSDFDDITYISSKH